MIPGIGPITGGAGGISGGGGNSSAKSANKKMLGFGSYKSGMTAAAGNGGAVLAGVALVAGIGIGMAIKGGRK